MLAGGVQQTLQIGGYNEIVKQLGYPQYLLSILGVWKILGVVAILLPKFPLLKEWAYGGFFFAMSGAAISHFVSGQSCLRYYRGISGRRTENILKLFFNLNSIT